MASLDRALLVRLMAAMAAGDQAALFPFIEEFGDRLAGSVRHTLRSLGRHDMANDARNIDYLVQSAAFVIHDRAGSWDPDGALPWTWARAAIRHEIVSWLGHPSVELLEQLAYDVEPATAGAAVADVDFEQLSASYPLIGLLVRAVRQVANERDAEVHLEYQAQKSMGDRQPAHTVADMFDLSPANVRKINQRVRSRLSDLAATDPAFAALAQVAWVEAC